MANGKWQIANRVGYTLIELLVGISVIGIIFGIGFASYREFSRRQVLAQAASNLRSNLRLAQQKALAGEKPTGCTETLLGYTVSVTSSSYSVYADCTTQDPPAETRNFSGITVTTGTGTILFKILGQGTNLGGDRAITLKQTQGGATAVITVTPSGEIR